MRRMTSQQWALMMLGLWLTYVVARQQLDGWPLVIVMLCVVAGFAVSSVERWQNWQRARNTGGN